jgi:hypothetical protein
MLLRIMRRQDIHIKVKLGGYVRCSHAFVPGFGIVLSDFGTHVRRCLASIRTLGIAE